MGLKSTWPSAGPVTPRQAGLRLILLSLPFLALGLLWALAPPLGPDQGELAGIMQTLGVVLTLFGIGAVGLGLFLIRRGEREIL